MQNSHSEVDLTDLDSVLGPVLASSSGPAESRVLALLTKGISNSVPTEGIRLWIKSRCVAGVILGSASDAIGMQQEPNGRNGRRRSRDPRDIAHAMRSLTEAEGWGQLVASARERVLSSSGASRDLLTASLTASLDIARRVVHGVLTELPELPAEMLRPMAATQTRAREEGDQDKVLLKRNVGARAALVTVGLEVLNDGRGWDSVLMSQGWLGAQLGTHWQTAASYLDVLVKRRILTNPRSAPFTTSRYRVRKLTKPNLEAAQQWDAVARCLVSGEADPIAAVLRSVTHPAWTYSRKLTLTHWAMLLADTAALDPALFGIRTRMVPKYRADLADTGYDWSPGVMRVYLEEILDRLADEVAHGINDKATTQPLSAREAKARALAAYEVTRAANEKAATDARTQKKAAYAELADLLALHPIPRSPFGAKDSTRAAREAAVLAWVDALHGLVLSGNPTQVWRKAVGALLVKRLVQMKYTLGSADGAVSYIMYAPGEASLDEWLELDDDVLAAVISGALPMESALAQTSAHDAPSTPSRRRG